MKTNRICKTFSIRYPILQGGMRGIAEAILAAAVSNAGGLGVISGVRPLAELRVEIRKAKQLTKKPFGINLPATQLKGESGKERASELVRILAEEEVGLAVTSAGDPRVLAKSLKEANIKLIHVVASVDQARKAEDAGVDAVVASGVEGGGFLSHDEVATLPLLPQVVDAVRLPVIAGGGIADARGFVAALALGAEGIQMGTRFLATYECQADQAHKQCILQASDTSTEVVNREKGPRRRFKTDFQSSVSPSVDVNSTRYSAGQIAGLIKETVTVEQVICDIIKQAQIIGSDLSQRITALVDNLEP